MSSKPHLFFKNPREGVVKYKQKVRFVDSKKNDQPKSYVNMQVVLTNSMRRFLRARDIRHERRKTSLEIPAHIDYIEIYFYAPFDIEEFSNRYKQYFGLVGVKFELFNTIGLFAIEDDHKFTEFVKQIDLFGKSKTHDGKVSYNADVRFIKDFRYLTNSKILSFTQLEDSVYLNLVDSAELFQSRINPIRKSLETYLRKSKLSFVINDENQTIQIWNISQQQLSEIVSNFDIVHSVNSSLAGIVRPSPYGTKIMGFGFDLVPPPDNAPIIGILDSGISAATPLKAIIVNKNNEFDLVGKGSLIDNEDKGHGHGTGVACFAALGRNLIPDHTGRKQADAWLLSIKIYEKNAPRVADKDIIDQIRIAHRDFGVRIFVLTVTEIESKGENDPVSPFAYLLDKVAHDLDILIIISSGNISQHYFIDQKSNQLKYEYPENFIESWTNIKSPAESLNNLTVGSVAGNFEPDSFKGVAPDENFPAFYTSKFHYNFEDDVLNNRQTNKHLNKPDLLYFGGEWDDTLDCQNTGLKYLSARTGCFYDRNSGTSFTAGLIANLAAKILSYYPDIKMQTVKALIINAASVPDFGDLFNLSKDMIKRVVGKGIPQETDCLFSEENSVTIILEDSIRPDTIKSYPIHIPDYLLRKSGKTVLEVKATLCFSIDPILNNQMAYCPVHLSFGLFKNLELTSWISDIDAQVHSGINDNLTKHITIKNGLSWSEDYYFKNKLLSNSQKMEMSFTKGNIDGNENIFKLAVNCKIHKLLNRVQKGNLNKRVNFSIVFNFREKLNKNEVGGDLYSELVAINNLVSTIDLDAEATF